MDHPGIPKPTATFPPTEVADLLRSIMRGETQVTLLGGEPITEMTGGHVQIAGDDFVITFYYRFGGALRYIANAHAGKRWGDYDSWRRDFKGACPDNELTDEEFEQLSDFMDTLKPALPAQHTDGAASVAL